MTRRNFLLGLFATASVQGCSEYFQASPYTTRVNENSLNSKNLANIIRLPKKEKYKIALIADTHTFYDNFNKAKKIINARSDFDFCIHAGDLTDSGLSWEFEQTNDIAQKINLPKLCVVGNHDTLTNGKKTYKKMYGDYDFYFTHNNTNFVFLNNNNWEFDYHAPSLDFLRYALKSFDSSKPTMIVCHCPPLQKERFSDTQRSEFLQACKTYKVDMVLNGHDHGHGSFKKDNTVFLTCGSVQNRVFCEIDVDTKAKKVEFTPIFY